MKLTRFVFYFAIPNFFLKITWEQGTLPDSEYQDFGISFKTPPSTDGTAFYFPVLQTCAGGFFNNWSMIPSAEVPKPSFPAAKFTVMANGSLARASSMDAPSKNGASLNTGAFGLLLPLVAFFV